MLLGVSLWYLRTDSFFGADAEHVLRRDWPGKGVLVRPGTTSDPDAVEPLWASSTCDGAPAPHTMSVDSRYQPAVADRLPALFRAYVEDVTARRHCTDVRMPTPDVPDSKE